MANVEYTQPKPTKQHMPLSKVRGYAKREIENYGEVTGKDSVYHSIKTTDTGPVVTNGLQNFNHKLVMDKRIYDNTDYMERTQIGLERLTRDQRIYDEPSERRIYELPPGKWPKPKEDIKVVKKLNDPTYRPPSPLEEMTPFPDYERFKSSVTNYLSKPYEFSAQTNYLTGATSRKVLNHAKFDRAPGYHVPEQYNQPSINRPKDKRDIFYSHTRKYLPNFDSMNPIQNATPFTNRSRMPDSRQTIPSTARKTFD